MDSVMNGYILSSGAMASFQLPILESLFVGCLFSLTTLRMAFDEATLIVVASSPVPSHKYGQRCSVERHRLRHHCGRVRRCAIPLRDSTAAIAATVSREGGLEHAVESQGLSMERRLVGWLSRQVALSVARRHNERELSLETRMGCCTVVVRAWIKLGQCQYRLFGSVQVRRSAPCPALVTLRLQQIRWSRPRRPGTSRDQGLSIRSRRSRPPSCGVFHLQQRAAWSSGEPN